MPKQKQSTGKRSTGAFIIGRAAFEKISAVEGIRLTPAMKKRASASSKGLSAEETREAITRLSQSLNCRRMLNKIFARPGEN